MISLFFVHLIIHRYNNNARAAAAGWSVGREVLYFIINKEISQIFKHHNNAAQGRFDSN